MAEKCLELSGSTGQRTRRIFHFCLMSTPYFPAYFHSLPNLLDGLGHRGQRGDGRGCTAGQADAGEPHHRICPLFSELVGIHVVGLLNEKAAESPPRISLRLWSLTVSLAPAYRRLEPFAGFRCSSPKATIYMRPSGVAKPARAKVNVLAEAFPMLVCALTVCITRVAVASQPGV